MAQVGDKIKLTAKGLQTLQPEAVRFPPLPEYTLGEEARWFADAWRTEEEWNGYPLVLFEDEFEVVKSATNSGQ